VLIGLFSPNMTTPAAAAAAGGIEELTASFKHRFDGPSTYNSARSRESVQEAGESEGLASVVILDLFFA
jgi:hypothetical protein